MLLFLGARLSATPMSLATPEKAIQSLLHRVAPHLLVEKIESIPSAKIQQLYTVHLVNRKPLLLALPPPADVRPLRCERGSIGAEVAVLAWLGGSSSDHPSTRSPDIEARDTSSSLPPLNRGTVSQTGNLVTLGPPTPSYLQDFIPKLIEYGLPHPETNTPEFVLSDPRPGTTIAIFQTPLNSDEQNSIDYQAGQLFRRISCNVSPTGKFGYAGDVLRRNSQMQTLIPHNGSTAPPSDTGFPTWSDAFHLLLESVLRDMEDSCVQIAYGQVRAHFERLGHLLDQVKRSSLVALEAGESINLLASAPAEHQSPPATKPGELEKSMLGTTHSDKYPTGDDERKRRLRNSEGIRVTGLRDWSNCIFGDPLIAVIFANNPSRDFLHGLNMPISDSDPFKDTPVIEDSAHAPIRFALYQCYHSLCGIARQYRRPRDPRVDMELYWRKKLQESLTNLSKLDNGGNELQLPIRKETSPGD